jgi:hypothetical protein
MAHQQFVCVEQVVLTRPASMDHSTFLYPAYLRVNRDHLCFWWILRNLSANTKVAYRNMDKLLILIT